MIVTRGQRPHLTESLAALAGSESVIVVDDASSDTEALDEPYPAVHFIRIPRSFGLTRALNIGIRAAKAEYVLLLSPEVIISPATIAGMTVTLEAQPEVGAVCPLLLSNTGEPVAQICDLPSPSQPDPPLRAAAPGDRVACLSGKAILLRSFFLGALRNVDERYGDYGASIELSQQVKRAGKSILIHPSATAILQSAESKTNAATEADRDRGIARYLTKHHGMVPGQLYLIRRAASALLTLRFTKLTALFR